MKTFKNILKETAIVHAKFRNQDGHKLTIWEKDGELGHDLHNTQGLNISASSVVSQGSHEEARDKIKHVVSEFGRGGIVRARKTLEHETRMPWKIEEDVSDRLASLDSTPYIKISHSLLIRMFEYFLEDEHELEDDELHEIAETIFELGSGGDVVDSSSYKYIIGEEAIDGSDDIDYDDNDWYEDVNMTESSNITKEDIHGALLKGYHGTLKDSSGKEFMGGNVNDVPKALRDKGWKNVSRLNDSSALKRLGVKVVSGTDRGRTRESVHIFDMGSKEHKNYLVASHNERKNLSDRAKDETSKSGHVAMTRYYSAEHEKYFGEKL